MIEEMDPARISTEFIMIQSYQDKKDKIFLMSMWVIYELRFYILVECTTLSQKERKKYICLDDDKPETSSCKLSCLLFPYLEVLIF